ncbi:hypothetical protein GCM10009647_068490 [Streptomyces sanglieri]
MRKYSHTQWEITSTGYRCPLYDGGVLPTDNPLHHDQPEDHPTRQDSAPDFAVTGTELLPALEPFGLL